MIAFSKKKYHHLLVIIYIIIILSVTNLSSADAKGVTVGGFVWDKKDKPVKEAEIVLSEINGSYQQSNLTNEFGEYRFYNVPQGNYSISCFYKEKLYYKVNQTINFSAYVNRSFKIQWDTNSTGPNNNVDVEEDRGKEAADSAASILILFTVATIIILLLSLAIFSRIRRSQLLKHDTRQRICSHIQENPGKHFTALKNELALSAGVMTYHLDRLERENFILSRMEGKFKRFYPPRWDHKPDLHITPIQETILEQIKKQPGISQSDITKKIGRNRKVVNYQVHQLEDMDLIAIEKDGRESMCYFVRNA